MYNERLYNNIILIPYRNRKQHIDYFLEHSWKLLKEHLPNTKLVIIEQEEGKLFNRGKLLNIGFTEYLDKTEYFFTQDVDVNPNKEAINLYNKIPNNNEIIGICCPPCKTLGCIIKIKNEDIKKINGFPNNFWGWGVEDRVLYNRAIYYDYNISFIVNKNDKRQSYFYIFNDIDDRKRNQYFRKNTIFEYDIFHKLPKEKQLQHIMSSGLNNLEYTIIEKKELETNVEWIKVSV
jgi:hypothetical protein